MTALGKEEIKGQSAGKWNIAYLELFLVIQWFHVVSGSGQGDSGLRLLHVGEIWLPILGPH